MTTGLHTANLANAGLRECVKCGQVTDDFPNVALGYLGDSPMTLLKAADYLMEWES